LWLSKAVESLPFGEIVCKLLGDTYNDTPNTWNYYQFTDGDFRIVVFYFGQYDANKKPMPSSITRYRKYEHVEGFDVLVIRAHSDPRHWTASKAVQCFKKTYYDLKIAGY
jgi:hypothetical protein